MGIRTLLMGAGLAALLASGNPDAADAGGSVSPAGVDPAASWVVAVTGKAGALGFMGHEHAILVADWKGELEWRPDSPATARARFTAPTKNLRIDTKQGRDLAGLGDGPDDATVQKVQNKMLDVEHLAAERYPEIVFEITGVESAKGATRAALTAQGQLTLRGKTSKVRFPIEVAAAPRGATRFSGRFTVKHSDFGIEPESVAGVVKVADEVSIRFQVQTAAGQH